jgi:hypothetical protein
MEREKRAPVFEWITGAIPYYPDEALKVRVFMASTNSIALDDDTVIGQMWIPAPVLPMHRAMMHPEVLTLSLGSNVGVIHLSLRGPALRRKIMPGCACACCGCCVVPICGSPPCVPACSVLTARSASCCLKIVESDACRTIGSVLCCCCVLTGITFVSRRRLADVPHSFNAGITPRHLSGLSMML